MFEPSYNDLKFTIQNHNYICTNLILRMFLKIYSILGPISEQNEYNSQMRY